MNRRGFIKKILGAGAALYVPERSYSFLFGDKCGSWRKHQHSHRTFRMVFCDRSGLWTSQENGVWLPPHIENDLLLGYSITMPPGRAADVFQQA